MNLRRQKTEIVFSLLTFLKCKKNSATRDPVQLGTPTVGRCSGPLLDIIGSTEP